MPAGLGADDFIRRGGSVRYSVISGSKVMPAGSGGQDARRGRLRRQRRVVTGGLRLGMTMARPNWRAVSAARR